MRPQQQNRRMRGRGNNNNNNNRKGPNPLTRSYESNGPDVKIRGTAQQVAEKYTALARDAQSSGDRVMAENYLQHAEHYNRIIATALAQQQQFQQQQQQARDNSQDDFDEDGDDDRQDRGEREMRSPEQPQLHVNGFGPQPVIEGMPTEPGYQRQPTGEHPHPEGEANGGNSQQRQAEGEDGGARRGRRPRRPMRNRADQQDEGAGDDRPARDEAAEAAASEAPEAAE